PDPCPTPVGWQKAAGVGRGRLAPLRSSPNPRRKGRAPRAAEFIVFTPAAAALPSAGVQRGQAPRQLAGLAKAACAARVNSDLVIAGLAMTTLNPALRDNRHHCAAIPEFPASHWRKSG